MRTIIVGDVHGCATELSALLDRVGFTSGDRLVSVGDVVARGPAPLRVLDILRETGAILVRGNHEQKVLDWWETKSTPVAERRVEVGRMHRAIARALRPVDWTLLSTSRLWLDLPEHGVRVIHAGLDPTVPFERQSPTTMMHIRTVRAGRGTRGEDDGQVLWGARYAGPPHVVFGHNAMGGLQLHPWATGLDTGCVYGGRLTALVLAEGQKVPRALPARKDLLVSEPARRVWYEPGTSSSTARPKRVRTR